MVSNRIDASNGRQRLPMRAQPVHNRAEMLSAPLACYFHLNQTLKRAGMRSKSTRPPHVEHDDIDEQC